MIFCSFYLPVTSALVFIVLNRIRLSDDDEKSKKGKMFFFLTDPIAYTVVPFQMVPFIAFCVGIFLPDYDSSEFDVDSGARNATAILGVAFIVIFLLCNIQATLIFVIIVIVISIIVIIICLAIICPGSGGGGTYHRSSVWRNYTNRSRSIQESDTDQTRSIQESDTDQSRSTLQCDTSE